jgi:hypothetical protein
MMPTSAQELRARLGRELLAVREGLPREASGGDIVPAAALSDDAFERLEALGNQSGACVLVHLLARRGDGTEVSAATRDQADLLFNIAVQRLGGSVRGSDLVVRAAGDQVAWLLPGAGALETRGLARRLLTTLGDGELWLDDEPMTLCCRVGSALSTPRQRLELGMLLRAAARAQAL